MYFKSLFLLLQRILFTSIFKLPVSLLPGLLGTGSSWHLSRDTGPRGCIWRASPKQSSQCGPQTPSQCWKIESLVRHHINLSPGTNYTQVKCFFSWIKVMILSLLEQAVIIWSDIGLAPRPRVPTTLGKMEWSAWSSQYTCRPLITHA